MYDMVCISIFIMVDSVLRMTGAEDGYRKLVDMIHILSILVCIWLFFLIFYRIDAFFSRFFHMYNR